MKASRRKAQERDRYVLELYERCGVSYEKLGLELGLSASVIGFHVRRGRAARTWEKRERARKRDLGLDPPPRIVGERRPRRGRY